MCSEGDSKICWSTSLRKFSIRKCHLLGCVVSDHFFTGHRWYQQLPLYACSVSSGPLILTWSVGRLSDLSGLVAIKSKLLVSTILRKRKTSGFFNLSPSTSWKPKTLSWKTCKYAQISIYFQELIQRPQIAGFSESSFSLISNLGTYRGENFFLFVMLPLCSRFRSVRGLNFLERGCHDYFQYLAYFKEFANVNWSGRSASILINGSSGFYPMS